MQALSHVVGNRPAEARTAYLAYARLRQQTPEDARSFVWPAYLGAEYVEADLRRVLVAIERGQSSGWGKAERAIVHDLLGDALLARARNHEYAARSFGERGKSDAEREARRSASAARQAATREYQAALALDPTDEEARRSLGE